MRTVTISIIALTLFASLSLSLVTMRAQGADNGVFLLQPDVINKTEGATESSLGNYLSLLFKTLIGLAGGIATLIIVVEGLKYIVSGVPGVKTEAKGRIREALVGLILALAAWLILNTINPDLVNLNLQLKPASQTAPSKP